MCSKGIRCAESSPCSSSYLIVKLRIQLLLWNPFTIWEKFQECYLCDRTSELFGFCLMTSQTTCFQSFCFISSERWEVLFLLHNCRFDVSNEIQEFSKEVFLSWTFSTLILMLLLNASKTLFAYTGKEICWHSYL